MQTKGSLNCETLYATPKTETETLMAKICPFAWLQAALILS